MVKPMLFLAFFLLPVAAQAEDYTFDVFQENRPLGQHRFQVNKGKKQTVVVSQAGFSVQFMSRFAYRYGDVVKEVWENGCLVRLDSRIRQNEAREEKVIARQRNGMLEVHSDNHMAALRGCVRSFAYWDQNLLMGTTALLDPQTGRLVPVTVSRHEDSKNHLGRQLPTIRLDIVGEGAEISAWYHRESGRWIALESMSGNNRLIYILNNAAQGQ